MWKILHMALGRKIFVNRMKFVTRSPPWVDKILKSLFNSAIGAVNIVLFDKTGTITEEGLQYEGVLTIDGNMLGRFLKKGMENEKIVEKFMGVCHSLASVNGNLLGFLNFLFFFWNFLKNIV